MSKKLRGPATAVVAGNVPAPVRVRLKRVTCVHAIPTLPMERLVSGGRRR